MIKNTYLDMIKENTFVSSLTNEIYGIIDEEMLKGDSMNCELVDSLVEALEILQQEDSEKIFGMIPFMLEPRIIKNKATRSQNIRKVLAIAASLALIFSGVNNMLQSTQGTTLVREINAFFNGIREYFDIHNVEDDADVPPITSSTEAEVPEEPTSEEETPVEDSEPAPVIHEKVVAVKLELISSDSFKTNYLWQEPLELTGLSAVAVYSNGTKRDVPISELTVTGFNGTKVGKQTVTVSFDGVSSSFTVNVTKTEQGNLETRKAVRAELLQKELYAPNNLEMPISYENNFWRYIYSDGTLSPWQSLDELTLVTEIDRDNITTTQTLTYQTPEGLTVTASVQLFDSRGSENGKSIRDLSLKRVPKQIHQKNNFNGYYVYQNAELDISGFMLYVFYKDSGTEIITAETPNIGIYGDFTATEIGDHTVVFTYGDKILKFSYTVIEDDLDIAQFEFTQLWYTYYVNDGQNENAKNLAPDTLDVSHLVTAKFKGSNESLFLDVEIEGYDKSKEGIITVDVYFRGKYLGTTIIGQIYGDTGYVFTEKPEQVFYTAKQPAYEITVHLAKCIGNGRLETVEDFYNEPGNEDIKPSKYDATLITEIYGYKGFYRVTFRNSPSTQVEYQITFRPVTDYGKYTFAVCITDKMLANSNEYIANPSVVEEYRFNIEVKRAPNYIRAEVPAEPSYCHTDFEEQYKDKIRVFAVYGDGSEEEIFDYDAVCIRTDGDKTVGRYQTQIFYKLHNLQYYAFTDEFFIYEEGYEDAFYIDFEYVKSDYPGVCELGSNKSPVKIRFYAGSYNIWESSQDYTLEYLNFDTSTIGTRTATAVYTNALGTFTCDFDYTVVDKIVTPSLKIEIYDETALADPFTGLDRKYFDVYYTDCFNVKHVVTDECTINYAVGYTTVNQKPCFRTFMNVTYYDENTDTTFKRTSSMIVNHGNFNGFSVFQDEATGKFGVKVDADLTEGKYYEVIVDVYDVNGWSSARGKYIGSYSANATEFLIDGTILPTWQTQFYVDVHIIVYSEDKTEQISSKTLTAYYNIYD